MKLIFFKIFFLSFFLWLAILVIGEWPDNYVHIVFCDVGQGDAILISQGNRQILIDGGPDEKVLSCLEDYMPFWDKSIDFLAISHMDFDHIGGLPSVLSRYSIDVILKSLSSKKTAGFEALETAVSRENRNNPVVITSYKGQELQLGDMIKITVVSPQVEMTLSQVETETILSDSNAILGPIIDTKISENNLSMGLFIMIGDIDLLLVGDMEKQGELAVIDSGMTDRINIIKAGHHGSKSSSSRQFISIFRPEISVISSGKNNQYNHPSSRVIDSFREFEVDVYRTDSQGTVEFITDGIKYWRVK